MKLERCIKGHFYDLESISNCPYCENHVEKKDNITSNEEIKTVAYIPIKIEAVVGWLVCIEGIEKGKDYRLTSKRNFVGNSDDMDVCLIGDNTIDKNNSFTITYNEKQRIFVISPGSIGSIIYVNKKAIYETVILDNYSLIEIGEIKLVFIKFCGENFSWKI